MNTTEKITEAAESIGDDKLRAIMLQGAVHFAALFADAEADISQALNAAAEAGAGEEKIPPLSISFAVKLDLNANKQEGTLSVNIRHKHSAAAMIPEPNQPELGI